MSSAYTYIILFAVLGLLLSCALFSNLLLRPWKDKRKTAYRKVKKHVLSKKTYRKVLSPEGQELTNGVWTWGRAQIGNLLEGMSIEQLRNGCEGARTLLGKATK